MPVPDPAQTAQVIQRIRDSFARQTMMTTIGATLVSVAAGRVVLRAPIGPHVLQQQGAAHAGLAFMLGDSAAGYAALTLMAAGAEVMTVEMKINLMSPAIGDALEATGTVERAGRRITVTRATVESISGDTRKTVALLQGTMIPVEAG